MWLFRFPLRRQVESSNTKKLSSLTTTSERYAATDNKPDESKVDMDKNFMAPPILELRVGAQVMLIRNVDETLANGSVGRVLRFVDPKVYGTDLDDAEDDSHVIGAASAVEVVGSAVGKGAGGKAAYRPGSRVYPVVGFPMKKGERRFLVLPDTWKMETSTGELIASRTQVNRAFLLEAVWILADKCPKLPLILSWAMSIHKSQGQTLERVKVDLGGTFEAGKLQAKHITSVA